MDRSFKQEVGKLQLGAGASFHGKGTLAATKAMLQSGESYVGGYQGEPVSAADKKKIDEDNVRRVYQRFRR